MKTADQWSEEMNGETSPEIIRKIQDDALIFAADLVNRAFKARALPAEAKIAVAAIIDSLPT